MQFLNRLYAFTKRILYSRLYIIMIVSIIALTVIYTILPDKVKETDIKVGIYFEEYDERSKELMNSITTSNTIYSFYLAESPEQLRQNVESGKDECGFYIPEGFFEDYVQGIADDNIILQYTSSHTTMANSIGETLFCHIFKFYSTDILIFSYDTPEQDNELRELMERYISSDELFRIEERSSDSYYSEDITQPLQIPVLEVSVLLIIFAGLLGLLVYVKDEEKGYYIALRASNRLSLKLGCILGAILPVFLVSILCCAIAYGDVSMLLQIVISALAVCIFDFIPGFAFKKSSSLIKLLPIIMLALIPLVIVL